MARLKRFALLRLVACILGVKFDDLRQREHERQRRHWVLGAAAAVAACLFAAGGGFGYRYLMLPTTTHYRQVVWRWGAPQGLAPINDETRAHLQTNYAVTTQRPGILQEPHVIEVRRENSAGTPRDYGLDFDYEPGHARLSLHYAADGAVSSIDAFDASDRLARQYAFDWDAKNQAVLTFKLGAVEVAQSATTSLLDDGTFSSGQQNQPKTDITKNRLLFDRNGYIAQRTFLNNTGDPRHDAQNSYGERYQHSDEGLLTRRVNIGGDGNEIALRNGLFAAVFTYDANHQLVRQMVVGPDGNPFNGADGFAYLTRIHDSWGNAVATAYYRLDGKPALLRDGYSKVEASYDQHGNNVASAFFTERNDSAASTGGVAYTPALNTSGYAQVERKFDERSRLIAESYYSADGKPTVSKQGYASASQTFDGRGNIASVSYFGIDGALTLHPAGYAKANWIYNASNKATEVTYFGVDGKPTDTKQGFAKVAWQYDNRDNLVSESYFGIDGEPTLGPQGYASYRALYQGGNAVEYAYFGIDNRPTLSKAGIARLTRTYDSSGNLIEERYFGTDDKPIPSKSGYALLKHTFDRHGNLAECPISTAWAISCRPRTAMHATSRRSMHEATPKNPLFMALTASRR